MKLASTDLRILARIWDAYPIVYDPTDESVIAIGERPLLTTEDIVRQTGERKRDHCVEALRKLESFQCVASVYMHHPDEYAEQTGKSGKTLRLVVLGPSIGHHAYQVTDHGKQRLDSRFFVRMRNGASSVLAKAVHDYLHMLLAFLLGAFLTSYFGFTFSGLPSIKQSAEPSDAPETSKTPLQVVDQPLGPGDR